MDLYPFCPSLEEQGVEVPVIQNQVAQKRLDVGSQLVTFSTKGRNTGIPTAGFTTSFCELHALLFWFAGSLDNGDGAQKSRFTSDTVLQQILPKEHVETVEKYLSDRKYVSDRRSSNARMYTMKCSYVPLPLLLPIGAYPQYSYQEICLPQVQEE